MDSILQASASGGLAAGVTGPGGDRMIPGVTAPGEQRTGSFASARANRT